MRLSLDEGYDQAIDRVIVDAAISRAATAPPGEIMFVYISYPDPVGHDHGWDSDEYLESVAQADNDLGRLVDGIPADWHIVVTTDHGGHGRVHGTDCLEDMETFVVVRSPRLPGGTRWSAASILDIAPTVADLAGIAPEPGWVGRSLVSTESS